MSLNENVTQERCYLAFDFDTELTTSTGTDKNKTYLPPDVITVDVDIFHCAVICFQPGPTSKEPSGSATLLSSFMKCDVDIRKELYVMSCCQVARRRSK